MFFVAGHREQNGARVSWAATANSWRVFVIRVILGDGELGGKFRLGLATVKNCFNFVRALHSNLPGSPDHTGQGAVHVGVYELLELVLDFSDWQVGLSSAGV